MSVKYAGKQGKYGIIRHSPDLSAASAFKANGATANQWTNPVLTSTNFRTILLTALTPTIDSGATIDNYNTTSQLGLSKEVSNFFIDSSSGLAKFNFSAIADKNNLVALLVGALQAVSTDDLGGGLYDSTITDGFKAGTIDFSAGGGYLLGMCEKIGASADDGTLLQYGIVDSLTLTFDFNAKGVGRLVGVNGTLAFRSVAYDQTLTGTFVDVALSPFGNTEKFSLTTFSSDAVDLSTVCVQRIEITISNSVTSNCATTGGEANQYDVTPMVTANVIVDHNTLTEKLRNDFKSGATVAIKIASSLTATASGYLEISMPVCKMTAEPMVYNGDYYGYNMPLEAYQNSTTSKITIKNVCPQAWDFNVV